MKTPPPNKLLPILGALCLPASFAPAATLFSDNFESYPPNSVITAGGNWATVSASGGSLNVVNTGTPFGATTQYLEYVDSSSSGSVRFQSQAYAAASNALTTFSFDFNEPGSGFASSMNVGYAIDGSDLLSASRRIGITLDDGTVGGVTGGTNSYSVDTAYTLFMIFNDTASSVNYQGGIIPVGDAHIWLENLSNGTRTFAGSRSAENLLTDETGYSVAFRSFSSNTQSLNIDNVSFIEGAAAIPEPSAALFGGLGLLLVLRRHRRGQALHACS